MTDSLNARQKDRIERVWISNCKKLILESIKMPATNWQQLKKRLNGNQERMKSKFKQWLINVRNFKNLLNQSSPRVLANQTISAVA
jgi:hypothetical protein